MPDLTGKVALITGATSGIGKAAASELAGMGATVILGVRNLTAGQEVAAEIKKLYPNAKVEVGAQLDLASQDSVRAFAEAINARPGGLDILINNAAMNFAKRSFTSDKVGIIAQVNYLGPYTLTRLLEKKLVASKARVVHVSSIAHRVASIRSAQGFLTDFRQGFYPETKLANTLFAFELQRRLGPHGVQSVAADPGSVRSNIWNSSPAYSKGLARTLINIMFAPPEDGTKPIVHAAVMPWSKDARGGKAAKDDLRYYARGGYATQLVQRVEPPPKKGFLSQMKWQLSVYAAFACAGLDYPVRKLSGGALASKVLSIMPSKSALHEGLAQELWDVSAEIAKLSKEPQI